MKSTYSILIVDDDPAHRLLIKRAIRAQYSDFQLYESASVAEALSLLKSQTIDLITLDLNLNGESGFDLLKAVREDRALDEIIVIIISTSQLKADINNGYLLGANCYLTKSADLNKGSHDIQAAIRFFLNLP